jgi:dolichyl-phosphate-mannose-protein mannosyltransferase
VDIFIRTHTTILLEANVSGFFVTLTLPHSHILEEQQITLYPHRDSNNNWLIANATEGGTSFSVDFSDVPFEPITSGMHIRLHHILTEKRLHSHDVRPPISEVDFQNEVSAYGFSGFMGDANDDWAIEIDEGDKHDRESSKRLRTLRTKFRLRHLLTGCYLFSHKVKLPEWGFEQQEVTCNKNAVRDNSLWYIETNTHPNCTWRISLPVWRVFIAVFSA